MTLSKTMMGRDANGATIQTGQPDVSEFKTLSASSQATTTLDGFTLFEILVNGSGACRMKVGPAGSTTADATSKTILAGVYLMYAKGPDDVVAVIQKAAETDVVEITGMGAVAS